MHFEITIMPRDGMYRRVFFLTSLLFFARRADAATGTASQARRPPGPPPRPRLGSSSRCSAPAGVDQPAEPRLGAQVPSALHPAPLSPRPPNPSILQHAHTAASRGGKFLFDFNISGGYPHDAPKVKCKTKARWPALRSALLPALQRPLLLLFLPALSRLLLSSRRPLSRSHLSFPLQCRLTCINHPKTPLETLLDPP